MVKLPTTIAELENWLNSNCSNNSYSIGSISVYDGCGLKSSGNKFVWYYTERGQDQELNSFDSEKEACEFAYNKILADKYAWRHMVAMVQQKSEADLIISELKNRNVSFETDEIPYGGLSDMRTRIFVFGCNHLKVRDLKR